MFQRSSLKLVLLVASVLLVGVGCAEERDPINRVQANALAKTFFVGKDLKSAQDDPEFYTAVTVTDVPYLADSAGVFPGLVGNLRRIKWEIEENILNARMTYEEIEDSDGHGSRTTNNGRVLAAYTITSHFDIKRSYNPSTGEELNVVEENSSDRPWYDRAYMRVDWSSNLVASSMWWDPISQQSAFGDTLETESLAYYVEDPASPDAPHFDAEQGYFDVTNKLYLKPKLVTVLGQTLNACLYRSAFVIGATGPIGNCENSEVTVRASFKQVAKAGEPGDTDYEPMHWDGSRMNAFGVFTVDRNGWDERYGIVDDKWYRFAQRYNIWQKSHTAVPCATKETYQAGLDPDRDGEYEYYEVDRDIDNQPIFEDGVPKRTLRNGEPIPNQLDKKGRPTPTLDAFNRPVYVVPPDGTDDECAEAGAGSQCDEFVGKCTIPYAQREPRTIAWHYTVNTDDLDIFEATEWATEEWDVAMRVAVQSARRVECDRTGAASLAGTRWEGGGECADLFPIDARDDAELRNVREVLNCWKANGQRGSCVPGNENSVAAIQPMVVLCHNPIAAQDDKACGVPGTVIRPGDIRYHQVNVWPTRQSASPWGYGPSLGDPLTGEIISAGINVYNSVTDASAQSLVDQVRWFNGEISGAEITTAEYVRDWVGANSGEATAPSQMQGNLIPKVEIQKRLRGLTGLGEEAFKQAQITGKEMIDHKALRALARQRLDEELLPPTAVNPLLNEARARIDMVKGSPVEAQLAGPMWAQMALSGPAQSQMPSIDPAAAGSNEVLDLISPLRGMDPHVMLEAERQVQLAFAQRGQCLMAAPEPTGIPTLARVLANKFPNPVDTATPSNPVTPGTLAERNNKMWNYLRMRMHYSVILHEMGHTIGERHNFTGSYDKFNYRPQYWTLRTRNKTSTERCTDAVQDGKECIGPRWWDPLDQDEIDQSIWTWQHTTVMDYPGDLTHDMIGLGVYDYAATRFFYAGVTDVLNDGTLADVRSSNNKLIVEGSHYGNEIANLVDFAGGIVGMSVQEENSANVLNYSEWDQAFNLTRNCQEVTPQAPATWNAERDGAWDPTFDGRHVGLADAGGNRQYIECERPPVDYVAWRDMQPDVLNASYEQDPRYFSPRRARDKAGRPRMPYQFESDEYADGWSPSTYRHDNGADMYEELVFHSNLYENRHLFDNYRNGKATFTIWGAYQRALSRYHVKIASLTQGFSYIVGYFLREFANNYPAATWDEILAGNLAQGSIFYDHAVAASLGFDHFARVLTRPHVGPHRLTDGMLIPEEDRIEPTFGSTPLTALHVPNGTSLTDDRRSVTYGGRSLNNDFQFGQGYWTVDYLNTLGSYYEKTYALLAMLEADYRGSINFRRGDGIDSRFHHVNYSDLYGDGMRRMIGLMMTDDAAAFGPRITASANPSGDLRPNVTQETDESPMYPSNAFGWVSFVNPDGPQVCWPSNGVLTCSDPLGTPLSNQVQSPSLPLDPQIGFEVQKFIAFYAYVYQPAAGDLDWADMMRIYRVGTDTDPSYLPSKRIEWRDPESGIRYIAPRFGEETIMGKKYDKGVAAKMIQWINTLTEKAYALDPVQPFDPITGAANVLYNPDGTPVYLKGTRCEDSGSCQRVRAYRGLVDFVRETAAEVGFPTPDLQVIGDEKQ